MQPVSIRDACNAAHNMRQSLLLEGPPGSGKTEGTRAEMRYLGYNPIVVSCQNIPDADIAAIPIIQPDGSVRMAHSELWTTGASNKPKPDRPACYILDELFKAPDATINALLPLVHSSHELNGIPMHPETRVIVTSNMASMRLGDKRKPHMVNRLVALSVANPSYDEAEAIMIDCGYDGRVIDFVRTVPTALNSYDAAAQERPQTENGMYWGFDYRTPSQPFCSMRSLEAASDIVRANSDSPILPQLLAGAIGAAAASRLLQHLNGLKGYVPIASIFKNPHTAALAPTLLDMRVTIADLIAASSDKTMEQVYYYIKRLPSEVQLIASRLITAKRGTAINPWTMRISTGRFDK